MNMLRIAIFMLATLALTVEPARAQQTREDVMHFPSGTASLNLYMLHVTSGRSGPGYPVLILHGATFPSGSSAAWKIGGRSWMDELANAGYDVYALDFLGYGGADRYPEMAPDDPSGRPLGDVQSMVDQVNRAVEQIGRVNGGTQLDLIAHSAGTFVAGRYAELHPERVARLVLFGAPAPTEPRSSRPPLLLRHVQMSGNDELDGFEPKVRDSGRLDMKMFQDWVNAYLATDPAASQRQPPSVRVPTGMVAASANVKRLGQLPYEPSRVIVPTLVIVGDWDAVAPPTQGLWLFERLGAPLKRFVIVSRAGHRMQLEQSRFALYREVEAFLKGGDEG
jgi:pimeloyl-ACP methyl ester carboxylesterase